MLSKTDDVGEKFKNLDVSGFSGGVNLKDGHSFFNLKKR